MLLIQDESNYSGLDSFKDYQKTSKYEFKEYSYISYMADSFCIQKNKTEPHVATSL